MGRLRCTLGRLSAGRRYPARTPRAVLKGTMQRTLVVREPTNLFSEAVFILKPETAASGISQRELLHQAREAAGRLMPVSAEDGGDALLTALIAYLLGALSAVGVLWLMGIVSFT